MDFCYRDENNRYSYEGLVSLVHRWSRNSIKDFLDGLSQSEFCMMMFIGYNHYIMKNDAVRNIDLAEQFQVSAPAISRMLRNLEKRGLIRRQGEETDRRNSYIYLTKEGLQMVASSKDNLDSFFTKAIDRMGREKFCEMMDLLYSFHDCLSIEMKKRREEEKVNV